MLFTRIHILPRENLVVEMSPCDLSKGWMTVLPQMRKQGNSTSNAPGIHPRMTHRERFFVPK